MKAAVGAGFLEQRRCRDGLAVGPFHDAGLVGLDEGVLGLLLIMTHLPAQDGFSFERVIGTAGASEGQAFFREASISACGGGAGCLSEKAKEGGRLAEQWDIKDAGLVHRLAAGARETAEFQRKAKTNAVFVVYDSRGIYRRVQRGRDTQPRPPRKKIQWRPELVIHIEVDFEIGDVLSLAGVVGGVSIGSFQIERHFPVAGGGGGAKTEILPRMSNRRGAAADWEDVLFWRGATSSERAFESEVRLNLAQVPVLGTWGKDKIESLPGGRLLANHLHKGGAIQEVERETVHFRIVRDLAILPSLFDLRFGRPQGDIGNAAEQRLGNVDAAEYERIVFKVGCFFVESEFQIRWNDDSGSGDDTVESESPDRDHGMEAISDFVLGAVPTPQVVVDSVFDLGRNFDSEMVHRDQFALRFQADGQSDHLGFAVAHFGQHQLRTELPRHQGELSLGIHRNEPDKPRGVSLPRGGFLGSGIAAPEDLQRGIGGECLGAQDEARE